MRAKKSEIDRLGAPDILAILRAADELIARGGRSLLAKVLKGSRDKKVLEHGLDACPSYGYFRDKTLDEITERIDWMIQQDFLEIEMSGKLPLIVFTERGWKVERAQYAEEMLREWDRWIAEGKAEIDPTYLKDRNRGMILLFLKLLRWSGDTRYIPYLRQWEKIDCKKVQAAIRETIRELERGIDREAAAAEREQYEREIQQALRIAPLEPEVLKCWECGKRFVFAVEEQKFFRMKGFEPPKRCPACRERKRLRNIGIE
mgnify:CR=1 FL=1